MKEQTFVHLCTMVFALDLNTKQIMDTANAGVFRTFLNTSIPAFQYSNYLTIYCYTIFFIGHYH